MFQSIWLPHSNSVAPSEPAHHSLFLDMLEEQRCAGERSLSILDLGPSLAGNLEYYSSLSRFIHIENIWEAVSVAHDAREQAPLDQIVLMHTPITFDLVLAWDLFNYLEAAEIELLQKRLNNLIKPGGLLHVLVCLRKDLTALPYTIQLAPDKGLIFRKSSTRSRPSPCYNKYSLAKLLPAFQRQSSLILTNGYEEQVWTPKRH